MSTRFVKKSRRFNNKRNNFSSRNGRYGARQMTATVSGREAAFILGDHNGGAGALVANNATPTDTGGTFTLINPLLMGTRLATIADVYNQWRCDEIVFTYQSAFMNTQTTPAGNDAAYIFAAGFVLDPTVGTLNQDELVQAGGRDCGVNRVTRWVLRDRRWFYCFQPGSDTADTRWTAPGSFHALFYRNGSATANTYGTIDISYKISFRFPLDSGLSPPSMRNPVSQMVYSAQTDVKRSLHPSQVQKSSDDSPLLVSLEPPECKQKAPSDAPKNKISLNISTGFSGSNQPFPVSISTPLLGRREAAVLR